MGEMTFIKDGFAKTIGRDGEVTVTVAVQCDGCFKWSNGLGGLNIKDVGQEVVMWLCADCRK
jgi:hypothetical protein